MALFTIEIGAHSDSQGDGGANKQLTQARADSVRAYLVGHGIEGRRIRAVGYGAARPIASNENARGRAENRRVEITITSR